MSVSQGQRLSAVTDVPLMWFTTPAKYTEQELLMDGKWWRKHILFAELIHFYVLFIMFQVFTG